MHVRMGRAEKEMSTTMACKRSLGLASFTDFGGVASNRDFASSSSSSRCVCLAIELGSFS